MVKTISEIVDGVHQTYEYKARDGRCTNSASSTTKTRRGAEYLCAAVVFSILHLADCVKEHR